MGADSQKKIRVLTFVGYYLPGYKAGGQLRTVANMADTLHDSVEFWIVTRDRDEDDTSAYGNVRPNAWQAVGNAHVYYFSPDELNIRSISKVVTTTPHDVLYINSFFDPIFTLKTLLGCIFLKSTNKPVILAPRGEFSEGALGIKSGKKRLYIRLLPWLFRDVRFQASSQYEKNEILRALAWLAEDQVSIAIDLPTALGVAPPGQPDRSASGDPEDRCFKLIFLSRVSRIKNLDYALSVLQHVASDVVFDIYGPQEDPDYWRECQALIEVLPAHIRVNYCGNVMPDRVKQTFSDYDLFFFPTRGENYGHVIAESISAGTPVLLSDQTPWRDLESEGLGWDLPLRDPLAFAEKIDHFVAIPAEERDARRLGIYAKAVEKLTDQAAIQANKDLFLSVLKTKAL